METPVINAWPAGRKFLFRFSALFVLLFMLSFSFPHSYVPDVGKFTSPFFESLVKWVGDDILKIKYPYTAQLISDSTGMYIHAGILLVLSFFASLVWTLANRTPRSYDKLQYWFTTIVSYYLALQMLSYGFNKVFKWQFYLPEPNTLYTQIGQTPPDLLFWSTMGVSRPYTIFGGVLEVVAALLLLSRPTRLLGGLFSIGVMVNVVMINFSYDVSVKLYSLYLLLLSLLVVAPNAKYLFYFFILNKNRQDKSWKPLFTGKRKQIYVTIKTFIVLFFLADTLEVYIRTANYNDDAEARPPLHGAYEVLAFSKNGEELPPLTTDTLRWRRVFIHRRGYLITQLMNDEMRDYELTCDTARKTLIINDYYINKKYDFIYEEENNGLNLYGLMTGDTLEVALQKIDLQQLPAMQKQFHWTIDN